MVRIDNEQAVEDLLHVTYDSGKVSVEQMKQLVTQEGFDAVVR